MPEKEKKYNLTLYCRNCGHGFIETIPFGCDFHGNLLDYSPANYSKFYGKIDDYQPVRCLKCGSGQIIRKE